MPSPSMLRKMHLAFSFTVRMMPQHVRNMDHSPRIEVEHDDDDADDSADNNDGKHTYLMKDLENAVYGTQPTADNPSPLPDGLNGVLEQMVKCVLVMEAWCPQMLQVFDNDGDQYSKQSHTHTKHDFHVMPGDDMWPIDADGKPLDGDPNHIYKSNHMKQKRTLNGDNDHGNCIRDKKSCLIPFSIAFNSIIVCYISEVDKRKMLHLQSP